MTGTVSGVDGTFTLKGVPTGSDIPLVVQAGKWRRVITVPLVSDCATTQLPASGSGQARLPANQSEGTLPQMAILTGGCDDVGCFLRKVGVSAEEFGAPRGGGRVDVYQGLGATGTGAALSTGIAGDCTTSACPLWSSKPALERYDEVFLGCECDEHNETKPAASLQAMHDWIGVGGEVFATHSQATWFKNGPADLQAIANWTSGPASGAPGPYTVDTSSYGGMTLAAWLGASGDLSGAEVVAIDPADVSTSVTSVAPLTIAWIRDSAEGADAGGGPAGNVKLLSTPTPAAAADGGSCGRIVFTDIHPGGGQASQEPNSDGSSGPAPLPDACDAGPLSAGDQALEYLLFDQSPCGEDIPPPQPDQ